MLSVRVNDTAVASLGPLDGLGPAPGLALGPGVRGPVGVRPVRCCVGAGSTAAPSASTGCGPVRTVRVGRSMGSGASTGASSPVVVEEAG
ncbi:hypothetical protein Afil01_59520 [Actinorhabdospora filicis]|uniref:Uncharacterized protein n=1 Tax=Actinorhabdospora filicis TaxID=1785913 RepID=A0A9W6SQK9_9ACTN|nr:hypothetical protein Afil01_59520 [Actinorhabdospora filicis]